jgi:predicted Fe-Mo cluster-binding NifX family protein
MTSDLPGTLRVAVACDEHGNVSRSHFGEAHHYVVIDLGASTPTDRTEIDNPASSAAHDHDHSHGGEARPQAIGRTMGANGVQVLVGGAFGANIQVMRTRFLPVVVHVTTVDDALDLLQTHRDRLDQEWGRGADRRHLVLRP